MSARLYLPSLTSFHLFFDISGRGLPYHTLFLHRYPLSPFPILQPNPAASCFLPHLSGIQVLTTLTKPSQNLINLAGLACIGAIRRTPKSTYNRKILRSGMVLSVRDIWGQCQKHRQIEYAEDAVDKGHDVQLEARCKGALFVWNVWDLVEYDAGIARSERNEICCDCSFESWRIDYIDRILTRCLAGSWMKRIGFCSWKLGDDSTQVFVRLATRDRQTTVH